MDSPGAIFSASLQLSGSPRHRSGSRDVFSQSFREEDDEEALKWATIERLPTFERIHKGILIGSQGGCEVYVEDLGHTERKMLIERLVTMVDDDNEKFNGHEMDEFVPQRTSAYISQNDLLRG